MTYEEEYHARMSTVREILSRADGRELLYIHDMIGNELRARNERFMTALEKIQALEEERCVMSFLCDTRVTPKELES